MPHLQRKVGMFPLLPHLQAGEVGEPELQFVFLLEVLDNAAVVRVPTLHRQGETRRSEINF